MRILTLTDKIPVQPRPSSLKPNNLSYKALRNVFNNEDYAEYLGMYPGLEEGEEVLYPSGYTPSDYVGFIMSNAPAHWEGLMNSMFSYYGYCNRTTTWLPMQNLH